MKVKRNPDFTALYSLGGSSCSQQEPLQAQEPEDRPTTRTGQRDGRYRGYQTLRPGLGPHHTDLGGNLGYAPAPRQHTRQSMKHRAEPHLISSQSIPGLWSTLVNSICQQLSKGVFKVTTSKFRGEGLPAGAQVPKVLLQDHG